jgi:hypothetical protein
MMVTPFGVREVNFWESKAPPCAESGALDDGAVGVFIGVI